MDEVWVGRQFTIFHENVELETGRIVQFEYVKMIDGTRTIVENDKGEILLTKEFRVELDGYDLRVPGGKLDFIGENVEVAASRELLEETGIKANSWNYLWSTNPSAIVKHKRHFLLAREIECNDQVLNTEEKVAYNWFSREEIIKFSLSGQICEEISALSLLRYINM